MLNGGEATAQGSKVLWLTWGHRALDLAIPSPHSLNPLFPIIQMESRPLCRQMVKLPQGTLVNSQRGQRPFNLKIPRCLPIFRALHPPPLIFITKFTILWRPQDLRQLYPSVDSWPQQTFVWDVRMQFRIKFLSTSICLLPTRCLELCLLNCPFPPSW